MMLNQMAAVRSEPQWTQYHSGRDFEDCEYRVEEMKILGVKQKYIMIRGTFATSGKQFTIDMPAGVNVFYPMINNGFAIECYKEGGVLSFGTTDVTVNNASFNSISFYNVWYKGARFLIFARVR